MCKDEFKRKKELKLLVLLYLGGIILLLLIDKKSVIDNNWIIILILVGSVPFSIAKHLLEYYCVDCWVGRLSNDGCNQTHIA